MSERFGRVRIDRGQPPGGAAGGAALSDSLYDHLRALARRRLSGERAGCSVDTADLVHETYIRLARIDRMAWRGRTHFLAAAASEMRRVLVDRARAARARKRGMRPRRITLNDDLAVAPGATALEVLAVDEALAALARLSPRQARVAEMRVFAGMEVEEVADALGVSPRTVKSDWRLARAWLAREMSRDTGSAP